MFSDFFFPPENHAFMR